MAEKSVPVDGTAILRRISQVWTMNTESVGLTGVLYWKTTELGTPSEIILFAVKEYRVGSGRMLILRVLRSEYRRTARGRRRRGHQRVRRRPEVGAVANSP